MMTVELTYDKDCPNVAETRAELMRAFSKAGIAARWVEWDRGDPASPPHVTSYGSPTVLVDGKDVAGATSTEGVSCCRLYRGTDGGFRGAPTSAVIAEALKSVIRKTVDKRSVSGWLSSLTALPGIRRLPPTRRSVPRLLAGVCGRIEFARSWVLAERSILASLDRRLHAKI